MKSGKLFGASMSALPVRLAIGGGIVLALLTLFSAGFPATDRDPSSQPIQFNHRLHIDEVGEPCSTCHTLYETREGAGRPTVAICGDCHDAALTDSAEEEKLLRFVEEEAELPWLRATRLPSHVRFSHVRHVVTAQLDCAGCHGPIAEATLPPTQPLVTLNMNFCIDCHRRLSYRITKQSVNLLRTRKDAHEVLEDLRLIQGKRFSSGNELLAAFEELLPAPLSAAERTAVLAQVDSSQPVSVDCIACHR